MARAKTLANVGRGSTTGVISPIKKFPFFVLQKTVLIKISSALTGTGRFPSGRLHLHRQQRGQSLVKKSRDLPRIGVPSNRLLKKSLATRDEDCVVAVVEGIPP